MKRPPPLQDKCAELEAQLHRIQARAAMSASRRAHSAGPKKKGGKSKTAGENHASVTVVAVPHMGSPHNLSSSSIEEMMTRRVMDIIPVPQNLS